MNKNDKINHRLLLVREKMTELSLDAIYISSPENHRYLSDFHNHDGYLIVTMENLWVFADFRYTEAAKTEAAPQCRVVEPGRPLIQEVFRDERVVRVGYEDRHLTCRALDDLRHATDGMGVEFVPIGGILTELRAIKSAEEIECIAAAQKIAEEALHRVLALLTPEMTEIDVAAELEYQMKKLGSEGAAFETIAVSGSASSRPHGVPRNVKLERGFLTMDFGAVVGGYCSDMTRTVVIGKADTEMKRLYQTVLSAQEAAFSIISANVKNTDVDRAARDVIERAGYGGCFGHGLGHGVGLLIHEFPNLSPRAAECPLVPSNVVTVEPGIYLSGKYGCRIEDMVLVTTDGYKNLTSFPKEMMELFA